MPFIENLTILSPGNIVLQIPNPSDSEVAQGRLTMYDTWSVNYAEKDSEGNPTGKPRLDFIMDLTKA